MTIPMTARERILAAIHFQGPDRCPIDHYIFPGAVWRHGQQLVNIVRQYPDDFNTLARVENEYTLSAAESADDIVQWKDPWGTTWRKLRGYTAGEVYKPAIVDWDAWQSYEFPSLPPDQYFENFAADVKRRHPQEFVKVSGGGFFQHMQHLRGPANYFMDLAEDNEGVHELADRMVAHNLYSIKRHIEAGADCIAWGDDWGGAGPTAYSSRSLAAIFQAPLRENV